MSALRSVFTPRRRAGTTTTTTTTPRRIREEITFPQQLCLRPPGFFSLFAGGAFINSGHKDMSVGMIFIDTWVLSSSFPFSNVTSKAWADLEKTLDLAPKILDYIVVVADRPVYSSGSSKGDSMLQYYLEPLLKKANIDAYISGYDFNLEVINVSFPTNSPSVASPECRVVSVLSSLVRSPRFAHAQEALEKWTAAVQSPGRGGGGKTRGCSSVAPFVFLPLLYLKHHTCSRDGAESCACVECVALTWSAMWESMQTYISACTSRCRD